jgi:hypothetical protein
MNYNEFDQVVTDLEKALSAATGKFSNRPFELALHVYLRDARIARTIWKTLVTRPLPRALTGDAIYVASRTTEPEYYRFLANIPADFAENHVWQFNANHMAISRIDPVVNYVAGVSFAKLFEVYRQNSDPRKIPDDVTNAARKKKWTT